MSDPTHSAHVSGTVGSACPSAFPYGLPNVSYNAVTQFTKSDLDYIILSSDPLPEYGSLDTGSTTTTVVLSASASSVTDYYKYGYVAFASLNQRRQITAYNGATRTATLDLALPSAPGVGVGYLVRQHGGITSHGDWVNGWDQTNNNLLGFGGNITDYILSGCYGIADPARWGADNTSTNRSGDCHDNNVGALNRLHQPFSRTENATYYWVY